VYLRQIPTATSVQASTHNSCRSLTQYRRISLCDESMVSLFAGVAVIAAALLPSYKADSATQGFAKRQHNQRRSKSTLPLAGFSPQAGSPDIPIETPRAPVLAPIRYIRTSLR
jgi:hypothetical protein